MEYILAVKRKYIYMKTVDNDFLNIVKDLLCCNMLGWEQLCYRFARITLRCDVNFIRTAMLYL